MEKGLIHLYWGNGKGKTTAAMGVALRSLAAGKKVAIVQFLKGRESGEITLLSQLGARIYRGKTGDKFVFQMTEDEKAETRKLQEENLLAALQEPADLLILDEACAALELNMVEEALLKRRGGKARGPRANPHRSEPSGLDEGECRLFHRDALLAAPV